MENKKDLEKGGGKKCLLEFLSAGKRIHKGK